jgi:tRNA pseudouridine32 synthase / 23S rRNA pseudouridine746 synthase
MSSVTRAGHRTFALADFGPVFARANGKSGLVGWRETIPHAFEFRAGRWHKRRSATGRESDTLEQSLQQPRPCDPYSMVPIVYRDDDLIVLDKPSGLLAVPGRGPDLQDCLSARVQSLFPSALMVHRLDRDTSGLMIMALNPAAQSALSRQFAERTVEKRYVAVVFGRPPESTGNIDLPIRKDFDRPPRHMVDPVAGRPARTDWRLIEQSGDRSRLEVEPLTGRSHQIRLHLATLGHPILGDSLYAHDEARTMSARLLLHAAQLSISHPVGGHRLSWTAECPF